jgi:hypothetical protein
MRSQSAPGGRVRMCRREGGREYRGEGRTARCWLVEWWVRAVPRGTVAARDEHQPRVRCVLVPAAGCPAASGSYQTWRQEHAAGANGFGNGHDYF